MYTGELQAFRNVVSAEMLPPGTEGDRDAKASRAIVGPPGTEPWASEDYSQALKPNGIWPAKLNFLGTCDPSFLLISPFEIEMSVTYLSHHCILEVDNLFSRFIDPQMERNCAPGQTTSGVSPVPDLDESVSPGLLSTVFLGTVVVP